MNIEIRIDTVVGEQKFAAIRRALEPRTILDLIGARFLSYVQRQFRTRGEGRWAPLAWGTVALRQRGGSEPLQDTGRYKQSFVKESDGRTFVEVGSNLRVGDKFVARGTPGAGGGYVRGEYSLAKIHEYGTSPYIIRVRQARVLAAQLGGGTGGAGFRGRKIGMLGSGRMTNWLFFGKEVQHPGVPARPVLPTKEVAERLVQEEVDGMLRVIAGGSARGGEGKE